MSPHLMSVAKPVVHVIPVLHLPRSTAEPRQDSWLSKCGVAPRLAFLVGIVLTSVAWPGIAASGPAGGTTAAHADIASLPAALQGVISARFGADDSAFRVIAEGARYRTENSRHGFSATMGSDGLAIRTGAEEWRLRLTAWGRGESLRKAATGAVTASANRVEVARGRLTEWWVNGPLGLEQGWTVVAQPRGRGSLTLALAQSGSLKAAAVANDRTLMIADAAGRTVLRYAGLAAYDATGRELSARFEVAGDDVRVRIDDAGAVYPVRVDPWLQTAELTASDGAFFDHLGTSVVESSDGSTVVAGAWGHQVGSNSHQGAAYVFVKPAGGWANGTQAAELTSSDGAAEDNLGRSVAVSGDGSTVVAGALNHQVGLNAFQGAAYVFVKPAGGWANGTQTAELTASDGAFCDYLGFAVAVSGDGSTAVAGATNHKVGSNALQGAAYVFVKPSTGWANGAQTAELTASDGESGDGFGLAVAANGDGSTVVAGSWHQVGSNAGQGAAYVFVKPSIGWANGAQTAELTGSDGAAFDGLSSPVAVSGDGSTVVAGAPNHQVGSNSGQGAAYVFVKPSTGWADGTQTAELTASGGAAHDDLGSVAVSGDGSTVVAGSPWHQVGSNAGQGAAYVFVKPSTGWANATQTAELTASDGAADDNLGVSVAVSGDGSTVVAAAWRHQVGSSAWQGAAYVFEAPVRITPFQLISRLYPTQDEHQTLTLTNDSDFIADYQLAISPIEPSWPHLSPVIQGNAPNLHPSIGPASRAPHTTAPQHAPLPLLAGVPAIGMHVNAATPTLQTWPDATTPGTWSTVASEPGTFYTGGAFVMGDFSKLYVLESTSNQLRTLDTTTGAETTIGAAIPNAGEGWTGLAATSQGVIYGSATTCSGATSTLYTISPTTGAATPVGPVTNAPCLIDIAVNAAGEIFGVDIGTNNLLRISPTTGAGTVIGPTGIQANYAQGLSFDNLNGVLYWAAYNDTVGQGELRLIDTMTGASTLVGPFPGGAEVDAFAIQSFAAASLPWLVLTPASGSVDPGSSAPIDAHFIADGADHFGLFRATIKTSTDTPYPVDDVSVCFTKAFLDVPAGYWADAFVNGIAGARITSGCGSGNFCPDDVMTRGVVARWLLLARYGNLYSPPRCVGIFADVPCETTPNADYIEALYNVGITAGCGTNPLRYCPSDPVSRAQMAVFIMKSWQGPSYVPPACTGIFNDVPCPGGFAVNWIEDLYNHGITAGCGGGNFCPNNPTTRAEESVFITKAFSIPMCAAPTGQSVKK